MSNFPTILCGRNKRNFNVLRICNIFCLDNLIGYGLSTMLDFHSTVTGDIRTAGGSVNVTLRCINCTVNYNLCVYKIRFVSGICSTGSIGYGDECFVKCTCISTPLISVINVNVISVSEGALCFLANNNLGSGKESNILINRNITGHGLNGHVVLNTKIIVLRVNAGCTNRHINGRNRYVSIRFDYKSICRLVIILNNVSAGKVEHSATIGNKCYGRSEVSAGHVYGSICIFLSAGMKSKRNLNILEIVLRKGEYTIVHIGGLRTTTEVHDLEVLVHNSTTLSLNTTRSGDKAISVKRATVIHGDFTVSIHCYECNSTGGRTTIQLRTTGISVLCRNAN